MDSNDDSRSAIEQLKERQNAFEEQMTGFAREIVSLRRDYQVQAAVEQRRWADAQADIRELMFENQRILRWLEKQQ